MHAGAHLLSAHLRSGQPVDLGDLEAVRILDQMCDELRGDCFPMGVGTSVPGQKTSGGYFSPPENWE